jgi:hypothetical protein
LVQGEIQIGGLYMAMSLLMLWTAPAGAPGKKARYAQLTGGAAGRQQRRVATNAF